MANKRHFNLLFQGLSGVPQTQLSLACSLKHEFDSKRYLVDNAAYQQLTKLQAAIPQFFPASSIVQEKFNPFSTANVIHFSLNLVDLIIVSPNKY